MMMAATWKTSQTLDGPAKPTPPGSIGGAVSDGRNATLVSLDVHERRSLL